MLTARIVMPIPLPNKATGCPIDFPDWVGEAMVGLVLTVSHGGEGECHCLTFGDGDQDYSILPDDLITVMREQNPSPRSLEAAQWIDNNNFWAGAMSLPASCFDRQIQPRM